MRYILAFISKERLDAVLGQLEAGHVPGLSVSECSGYGQEHDQDHPDHRDFLGVEMTEKLRLEIVCHDDEVNGLVEALFKAAHTGRRGDGKVFVLPVLDALRLKTGERGMNALGASRPARGREEPGIPATDPCLVMLTCGSEAIAESISVRLVDESLAVNVTILSKANSYYRYEGTPRWDKEFQLLIYTTVERFNPVAEVIKGMHTKEIPEIFMMKIDQGSEASMRWIRRMGRP
jgi:nitrogen regulatory protein P-II 1